MPLPADSVRDGEVIDEDALSETLRELFGRSGLSKRVRVGVANQRTVLRTLELPPTPRSQGTRGRGQLPGPGAGAGVLDNAVIDLPPLGLVDAPPVRASGSCSWPPSAT